ncbi:MAG: hypothetical protein N4A72_03975 [Bacteroidales bacterium]|jgi:hypothetical protein|nr:hypothetical protein [Bacteroidales bacterium]
MIKNFTFILFLTIIYSSYSQTINVSGTVKSKDKNVDINNCYILLSDNSEDTVFVNNGKFKISKIRKSTRVKFVLNGHYKPSLTFKNDTIINITLYPLRNNDMTGKPVIYLYPEKPTSVSFRVKYDGAFYITYPQYNTGWNIIAYPDGRIVNKDDNKEYSYLFWNGYTNYSAQHRTYSKGYSIMTDTADIFLQNKLSHIGLLPKEYNELIVYWLPYIKKHKYAFVYFRVGKDYESISVNTVKPKPDSEIRVFIEFKGIDNYIEVKPQNLKRISREGFVLVEWGGSEITKPIIVNNINIK